MERYVLVSRKSVGGGSLLIITPERMGKFRQVEGIGVIKKDKYHIVCDGVQIALYDKEETVIAMYKAIKYAILDGKKLAQLPQYSKATNWQEYSQQIKFDKDVEIGGV